MSLAPSRAKQFDVFTQTIKVVVHHLLAFGAFVCPLLMPFTPFAKHVFGFVLHINPLSKCQQHLSAFLYELLLLSFVSAPQHFPCSSGTFNFQVYRTGLTWPTDDHPTAARSTPTNIPICQLPHGCLPTCFMSSFLPVGTMWTTSPGRHRQISQCGPWLNSPQATCPYVHTFLTGSLFGP